ncbi:sulfate transporter family-domain-containing protein [Auriculariales sp. MPI-PUGE-AT-0066]|nr:sulfate transporter family-domain-containing protein [Auriculariales sp. MPI-PUGE-AT-0066]
MSRSALKKLVGHPDDQPPVVGLSDYVREHSGDPRQGVINYLSSLFPILGWVTRYNIGWAVGDLIAGLTVGLVLVPQSMSYAKLASLPAEYGLYSSFVGVFIYCFFATSKDVSIGPVAVMSLEVGNIIGHIQDSHPDRWTAPEIAVHLSFICGFIVLGIGLLRIGWIVEFIPAPAVSGFMTGSAISIASGQVPGLFGISSYLNTRVETYKVIINTLKNLKHTRLDAAFGLVALASLYAIRWSCEYGSRRYPRRARTLFFVSILRNGFIIIVLTLSAWLYLRHRGVKGKYPPPSILLTVPRGFKHVGPPHIDPELVKAMAGKLPVATIILLLEHIAIAKSFGRLNGYKINPNQELVAIGVTNTVGTVFGAYPATGSFSRTALKSKSGVRTPAAGWITGLVVIVALYGLTDAFFWIPNAALSAVIIHAVGDLIASPQNVYAFWRVSPLEFVIWAAAVLVTIFSSIENGIYTSIGASAVLLLLRVARPRAEVLGRVRVNGSDGTHNIYLPVDGDRGDGSVINPKIKPEPVTPGVIVFRFEDSVIYPNASMVLQHLVDHAKTTTRRGREQSNIPLHDRPWNDPGPARGKEDVIDNNKPLLRAIVLDFSAVSQLDTTAVQNLIDIRKDLERFADGPIEFHFASIVSPWVRRALIAGGFGIGNSDERVHQERDVAPVVPQPLRAFGGPSDKEIEARPDVEDDLEARGSDKVSTDGKYADDGSTNGTPLQRNATPYFHVDLPAAVRSAELAAATPRRDV